MILLITFKLTNKYVKKLVNYILKTMNILSVY